MILHTVWVVSHREGHYRNMEMLSFMQAIKGGLDGSVYTICNDEESAKIEALRHQRINHITQKIEYLNVEALETLSFHVNAMVEKLKNRRP